MKFQDGSTSMPVASGGLGSLNSVADVLPLKSVKWRLTGEVYVLDNF